LAARPWQADISSLYIPETVLIVTMLSPRVNPNQDRLKMHAPQMNAVVVACLVSAASAMPAGKRNSSAESTHILTLMTDR
jgi:hypothetical protein